MDPDGSMWTKLSAQNLNEVVGKAGARDLQMASTHQSINQSFSMGFFREVVSLSVGTLMEWIKLGGIQAGKVVQQ